MTWDLPSAPELPPVPPPPKSSRSHDAIFRFLTLTANIAAFAAFVVLSSDAGVIALHAMGIVNPNGTEQVLLSGAILLSWAGFVVVWTAALGRPLDATLGWSWNRRYRLRFLTGLGMAMALAGSCLSAFAPAAEPSPIEKLIMSEGVIALAVLAVAVAPFLEELIFRGFLFRVIGDAAGPAAAWLCTTLLFAMLHVEQLKGNWAGIGVILVVGSVLGFLRLRSNSIIPSFIVHSIYNFTLVGAGLLIDWAFAK